MAFASPAGPPVSGRILAELTALIEAAGHDGFRDARGPLGLNQRQAGGKFTRAEAEALIERLQGEAEEPKAAEVPVVSEALSLREQALRKLPAEVLASELDRRGWIVIAP